MQRQIVTDSPMPWLASCCQLQATCVNFFAASRSALVILHGKNTKCRGGRIPRCAFAARLDGSMTLKHVCAVFAMRHDSDPTFGCATRPTPAVPGISATLLRLP